MLRIKYAVLAEVEETGRSLLTSGMPDLEGGVGEDGGRGGGNLFVPGGEGGTVPVGGGEREKGDKGGKERERQRNEMRRKER